LYRISQPGKAVLPWERRSTDREQNLESVLPSAVLLGGDNYLYDPEAALTGAEKGISALQILLYDAHQPPGVGQAFHPREIRYKLSRRARRGAKSANLYF